MNGERYSDVRSAEDRSLVGRSDAVVERVFREYLREGEDKQAIRYWADERGCGLRAVASSG